MPLVSRTFDQIINFTRTSSATFTGSNGLIQTTPQSVNLLTFTQEFDNAGWVKTNATIAANSIAAPDGTNTADTITAGAANATVLQSFSASAVPYTFSVWLRRLTGTGNVDITVDGTTYTTVAVTTTWTRFQTTLTPAAGTRTAGIRVVTSGDAVYSWGAQLQTGSTATTYTRNFGGLFPPRFDYNPVTLAPRGLLMEEQRTNLVTFSEQFNNAIWGASNVTVVADSGISPDGTSNADLIYPTTSGAVRRILRSTNSLLTAGVTYTQSVYVKAAGMRWVFLNGIDASSANNNCWFDLQTGTVGTVGATTIPTITNVGNGWYRITTTNVAGTSNFFWLAPVDANGSLTSTTNGTDGILAWGGQLEAGGFATSYIPTVASQVTRTGDFSLISDPNFTPWYNQSEGSLFVDAESFDPGTLGIARSSVLSNGPTLTNLMQTYASTGGWGVGGDASGVPQFNLPLSGTYTRNVPAKFAFAFRANDFVATVNGATPVADTSGTVPIVTQFNIGSLPLGTQFNGRIRRIVFYPTRLSNAQLQALTT
jgi:hypothetical protein